MESQGFFGLREVSFLLNHLKNGCCVVSTFALNCQFRGWFQTRNSPISVIVFNY